jgi:hypothetical protein
VSFLPRAANHRLIQKGTRQTKVDVILWSTLSHTPQDLSTPSISPGQPKEAWWLDIMGHPGLDPGQKNPCSQEEHPEKKPEVWALVNGRASKWFVNLEKCEILITGEAGPWLEGYYFCNFSVKVKNYFKLEK